jgi:hypothetical protein
VEGQQVETSLDELGGAKFTVNGRMGDSILVEVFVDGKRADSNYRVLGGDIDILWTNRVEKHE